MAAASLDESNRKEDQVRVNIEEILQRTRANAKFSKFCEAILEPDIRHIQIENVAGSFMAFLIANTHKNNKLKQVIIANDKESAAYLMNDLYCLLLDDEVLFLPDSFKRPKYFETLRNEQVQDRTLVSSKIIKDKPQILITYPEAILEMIVKPDLLKREEILIEKHAQIDIDAFIHKLVKYGFNRTEFVYEPGQFSIRGGIFDLFSFGSDYPVRIELFDDEVDRIRSFNPSDQLSIRNLERLSIIPNINTSYKTRQKVSLFDLLDSDKDMVWFEDQQMILDRIDECYDAAIDYANKVSAVDQSEWATLMRDRSFVRSGDILESLLTFTVCSLKPSNSAIVDLSFNFDVAPQRNFNKKFDFLIEHLKENQSKDIKTYICSSNIKQFKRFDNIFTDLNAEVHYQPLLLNIHEGFYSKYLGVAVLTDHQIFNRFHRYQLKKGFTKDQSLSLKMIKELEVGDYVTHIDHGVGRYSGLETIDINGKRQDSVRLIYKNNDVLYVSINSLHKITKYIGKDGTPPSISKLGTDTWRKLKSKTKKKVKDIAGELIKLYAKRKQVPGYAFPMDGYLQNELEASFIYEDTPDQEMATAAVKADMEQPHPMDRLVCGDVGFGKTEIALRAIFKSIVNGKQAALLVPTTILALQHYRTFKERLDDFGITIDYINRFRTSKEKKQIYERLEQGEIELIIGTHALLNKKTKFKDLGLLVVDEEQKFGVSAKEKLRSLKVNVDTLTLTATPIPRTLQFSLMAARDMSILRTAPPNRQAIHTEVRIFNEQLIKDALYYEAERGGQSFLVHNRVKSLADMVVLVRKICPDLRIGYAHGQLEAKQLESALKAFIDYEYDVLVCTNIIETGLDIANANTIIINNAHQFGLSDLHQLRGRVGRSNQKAYCYLLSPPMSVLTPEARKRLKTIEEFSELGSGLDIAMRDLDIRGAGNLLGAEQSGFISELGYDTYQKILNEAIQELKEMEFKEVFSNDATISQREYVKDVEIELEEEMRIPDAYVSNIKERLKLYTALDSLTSEEQLDVFEKNLKDRFGPIPQSTAKLFDALRLRWVAKVLSFERVILKSGLMKCFFLDNPQSSYFESQAFNDLMEKINHPRFSNRLTLKPSKKHLILIIRDIHSVDDGIKFLQQLCP